MRKYSPFVFLLFVSLLGCAPKIPRPSVPEPLSQELSWLNDMLIVVYTDAASDEQREALVRDFDLDFLDWYCGMSMNRGNFFRARGVRNSAPEEYEYQEALQFSNADAEILFAENGIAITLEGQRAHFPPTQYHGAYFMCHNAPKWHETVKQGLIRPMPFGHTLTQDNIGCPLNKGGGNFCQWCCRKFKQFMVDRYGHGAFLKFGVARPANFDPRLYILEKKRSKDGDALLEDPLVREYIRFQYVSHLQAWEDICRDARDVAAATGRPLPALYGNQYGAWGALPFATALSSRVDVVWVECGAFGVHKGWWNTPSDAWGPLVCKVGYAAGGRVKPVWLWPMDYAESGKHAPYSDTRVRIVLAEAFANGAVVVQRVGRPDSPCYKTHKEFSAFLSANRALFTERERLADVGLVYSFPTWMWRRFSSLTVKFPALQSFPAMARILEETHQPYDVVIFGHPDVWNDEKELRSLGKYRVLVLPAVDCVSDVQAKALREYVRAGGALLIVGDFALRDEEFRRRILPVFPGIRSGDKEWVSHFGKGRVVIISQSEMDAFLVKETRTEGLNKIKTALDSTLAGQELVVTNAPPTVWLNIWSQGGGRRLAVHLVNYDADLEKDQLRPARNFELTVRQPVACDSALLLSPDAAPQILPLVRQEHGLKVFVPEVRSYAIVVFTNTEELRLANLIAQAERLKDRIAVASTLRFEESIAPSTVDEARTQGSSADTIEKDLIPRLQRRLRDLCDKYTAGSRHIRSFLIERAKQAVCAFDFGGEKIPAGWKPINKDTLYDKARGYGWDTMSTITLHEWSGPDDLLCDGLTSRSTCTFQVDLPNDRYIVTVITFSPSDVLRGTTQVMAEGALRLMGTLLQAGVPTIRSFAVDVKDGQLNLKFVGYDTERFFPASGPVGPTRWLVNGVLIEKEKDVPAPACAEAQRHQKQAQGSLRDWLVIGPFEDAAREGMKTRFPPEKGDITGAVRYRTPETDGLAPISFNRIYDDRDGVVAYAQTWVQTEQRRPAQLLFTSTGHGTVWLNGQVVVTDHSANGLLTSEYVVPVTLEKGWNKILVKVCNYWPGEWGFAASLLDVAGNPISELRISPDADTGQAAKMASVSALAPPEFECAKENIELGGAQEVKITFENLSATAERVVLSLQSAAPNQNVVRIEPQMPMVCAEVSPGKRVSQTFSVRLTRCPAEAGKIILYAKAQCGSRQKQTTLRLRPVVPVVTITPSRGFVFEPFECVVDSMQSPQNWKPASDNVRSISVDNTVTHNGKPTLRVDLVYDGDEVEAFGRIRASLSGQSDGSGKSDWSSYNTLRYWVRCSDSDPTVKFRDMCMVFTNFESQWRALKRHSVPVNQWTLIEDDLTPYARDKVVSMTPHFYEQFLGKKGTYTWHIGEIRLTKASPAHPELDAVEKTPLRRDEGFLRLAVVNTLSRKLDGDLSLNLPAGWTTETHSIPVCLMPGKADMWLVRVKFPQSDEGRSQTIRAVLSIKDAGTIEKSIELRVPCRLMALRTTQPPVLDGLLDDRCWRNAEAAKNFVLNETGAPARVQSCAFVSYDDKYLYVAYRCDEPNMKSLVANVKSHDGQVWMDDCIEIYLQPNRADTSNYYHIVVNTLDVVRDERGGNADWNSQTKSKTVLESNAWTIEIAIPFNALGTVPKPGDIWGLNLCRSRQAKPGSEREFSCWSCTYGPFAKPERFGELVFGR